MNKKGSNKVHIIGGGVIGLCSAWYLEKAGYEVTVIDKTDLSDGCSHGNAGMIVPSHFIPLATPGVISQGIRWMFKAKSPFFIKPRLDLGLAQWLWRFYRSCSAEKVKKAMPALQEYHEYSKSLFKSFSENPAFDFSFEEKGLLILYKNAKSGKEELEVAEKAHGLGMEAKMLSADEVQKLESGIQLDVSGGVFYPGDAHLYPGQFMTQLVDELKRKGVTFLTNKSVVDFSVEKNNITGLVFQNGEKLPVDQVVMATGSWSAKILKSLGINLLLQDGKGYSVTLKQPKLRPSIPTILTEAKVAVTPMGQDLRIGGTLEISNLSPAIHAKRLSGITESISQYYPELSMENDPALQTVWHGFRPCSPDGLPYLGFSKKYPNLMLATGHAMMGMSLGPATGKVVAELMQGKKPSIDVALYGVDRF